MNARFILVLSVQTNLVRAALVTRELKIAAFAQQSLSTAEGGFDPAELWYKTKKVTTACLDIGRMMMREIAGLAIVTGSAPGVEWHERNGEIVAQGIGSNPAALPDGERSGETGDYAGTCGEWLLWNLTGAYKQMDLGKTRVRAPFEAELPVLAMLSVQDKLQQTHQAQDDPDRALRDAAQRAWAQVTA